MGGLIEKKMAVTTGENTTIIQCTNGFSSFLSKRDNTWILNARELGIEKYDLKTGDIESAKKLSKEAVISLLKRKIARMSEALIEIKEMEKNNENA